MRIESLVAMLASDRIASLHSTSRSDGGTVYLFQGQLPSFPHASKTVTFELLVRDTEDVIPCRDIEAILLHFWQAQHYYRYCKVEPTYSA